MAPTSMLHALRLPKASYLSSPQLIYQSPSRRQHDDERRPISRLRPRRNPPFVTVGDRVTDRKSDRRHKQGLALIPDRSAAEATHELGPNRISHPVIYEACRLHLRHIASGILGIEPKSTAEPKSAEQLKTASRTLSEHADALEKRETERKPE